MREEQELVGGSTDDGMVLTNYGAHEITLVWHASLLSRVSRVSTACSLSYVQLGLAPDDGWPHAWHQAVPAGSA